MRKPIAFTKEEVELIKKWYEVEGGPSLLACFLPNRYYTTITRKAWSLGLKNRVLVSFDESFFEKPNIANSFLAGFIAADGNIYKNRVFFGTAKEDLKFLLDIKQILKCDATLQYRKQKPNKDWKYQDKEYDFYCFGFTSEKMSNDLRKNFNIVPKKSLILEPPNLNNFELELAFIFGYLMGDGWVGKINEDGIRIGVLGTEKFCDWAKVALNKVITMSTRVRKSQKKPFIFEIYGDKAYIIMSYLYQIKLPFILNRKYEEFLSKKQKYSYLDKYIKNLEDLLNYKLEKPFHHYEKYSQFVKDNS